MKILYIYYLMKSNQQKEYEIKYGKKSSASSVTDKPEIYEVIPNRLYNNP